MFLSVLRHIKGFRTVKLEKGLDALELLFHALKYFVNTDLRKQETEGKKKHGGEV